MITYASVLPNGQIIQTGRTVSLSDLELISSIRHIQCEDWVNDNLHYWDGVEFKEYPPQPTQHHVWDGETWFDPRTETQLEDQLNQARAAASITKIDFLLRAEQFGFISKNDAVSAAKGEIPAGLSAIIDAMDEAERFKAEVSWGAATRVERLDPFIGMMADGLGINQEQLDMLFNIATDSL